MLAFSAVVAENTVVLPEVMAYRPGEFYRRELPPLRAVLRGVAGLDLLIVDSYADLDPSGRPGLGAHAHAEFGVPVIGVAKSAFAAATHAIPVLRGPLICHLRRLPAPTRLIWSGAWLAGSGTRRPAPCRNAGAARPVSRRPRQLPSAKHNATRGVCVNSCPRAAAGPAGRVHFRGCTCAVRFRYEEDADACA
jgi:hypothetical protein